MAHVTLLSATDNRQADAILRAVVGLVDVVFTGRSRAYYLVGSYADGTATGGSDIDLCVVPKRAFTADERETLRSLADACSLLCLLHVDLIALDEDILLRDSVLDAIGVLRCCIFRGGAWGYQLARQRGRR